MKALVFTGNETAEIKDIPKPEPGPGEVLVEMKASGICGSDLGVYSTTSFPKEQQYLARGHEPCGIVTKLGPCTRNVKVGDRVIIHHYKGCGDCEYCRSGWTQMCQEGYTAFGFGGNGGHEEFGVFPDSTCVKMPDELPFSVGAACSCGTGTAYQAVKRLGVSGLDTLAIYGQGPVGVSAMLFAKAMGAKVIAVDLIDDRLKLSKQLGADFIINANREDPVNVVNQLTHGKGADASLDCAGAQEARLNTLKSARKWGRACFVGLHSPELNKLSVAELFVYKQLTVFGSWTMSTHVLAECANYIVNKKIRIIDAIETFPLSEGPGVYKRFAAVEIAKKPVFVWP